MYLAGYIERMGTGTGDIIRLCKEDGLKEPEFIQEVDFRTVIWRTLKATGQAKIADSKEGNEVTTLQDTLQGNEEI
jgi:predicted HTH transcriptional regulator